jgi:hypothetical protein
MKVVFQPTNIVFFIIYNKIKDFIELIKYSLIDTFAQCQKVK